MHSLKVGHKLGHDKELIPTDKEHQERIGGIPMKIRDIVYILRSKNLSFVHGWVIEALAPGRHGLPKAWSREGGEKRKNNSIRHGIPLHRDIAEATFRLQ
jgi:hypothetical protein